MNIDTTGLLMMAVVALAGALFARWRLEVEARAKWPRLRVRKPTHVMLRPLFGAGRAEVKKRDYERARTVR